MQIHSMTAGGVLDKQKYSGCHSFPYWTFLWAVGNRTEKPHACKVWGEIKWFCFPLQISSFHINILFLKGDIEITTFRLALPMLNWSCSCVQLTNCLIYHIPNSNYCNIVIFKPMRCTQNHGNDLT